MNNEIDNDYNQHLDFWGIKQEQKAKAEEAKKKKDIGGNTLKDIYVKNPNGNVALQTSPEGVRQDIAEQIGFSFPIIKIRDYYVEKHEIKLLEVESVDFIPTLYLEIDLVSNNVLVINTPRDGDVVSVFMRPDNDHYRAIRADFTITSFRATKINNYKRQEQGTAVTMFFTCELFVPGINSDVQPFAFLGHSTEAMADISKRLNLGLNLNQFEEPNDKQVWYCMGKTPREYIRNIIDHSWKDNLSFYDGWIDLWYNLSHIDINKMLIPVGQDDTFIELIEDLRNRGVEYNYKMKASMRKEELPTIKVFTNHPLFNGSSFFIESYKPINRSTKITKLIGYETVNNIYIDNQEMYNDGAEQAVMARTQPAYNPEKLGTHMLNRGRAIDGQEGLTSTEKYSDNENNFYKKMKWGGIQYTMADGDADKSETTNDDWSGNVHKHYKFAETFNKINRLELEKLVVEIKVNGFNNGFNRGDRVPVLLLNKDFGSTIGNGIFQQDDIIRTYSGWFIISAVKYRYRGGQRWTENPDRNQYETIITLTRREWNPPINIEGLKLNKDIDMDNNVLMTDDGYKIPNEPSLPSLDYMNQAGTGSGLGGNSSGNNYFGGYVDESEISNDTVTPDVVSGFTPYKGHHHEIIYKIFKSHYVVTDLFGRSSSLNRFHSGIDIRGQTGTPLYMPFDGIILSMNTHKSGGNQLIFCNKEKTIRLGFAHLHSYAPGIRPGMNVKEGTFIARVGNTGTRNSHLHLTRKEGVGDGNWGNNVNPLPGVKKQHMKPLASDHDFGGGDVLALNE